MKKITVLFVFCLSILTLNSFSQIDINSSGYVGINQSSPAYNLDTHGSIRFSSSGTGDLIYDNSGFCGYATLHPETDCGGNLGSYGYRFNKVQADHVIATYVDENSDARLKENVTDLENVLEKVKKLHGVRYNLKSDFYDITDSKLKSVLSKKGKNQIGFLAQELKEVFPEVVSIDSSSNLYSVSYTRLIPVLVEAIKELETALNNQEDKINALEEEVALLKSELGINDTKKATIKASADAETPKLYQNTPNPFTNATKISYYLPEGLYSQSAIYIYDMNGSQLKSIVLNQSGNGQVSINSNELDPGMYMYALVVDGNLIDTKKMILTD